jgi:2-polyprenyl-3-methyl-5-hydroxy-6-metoxy-1,4-benzoquinol methylase
LQFERDYFSDRGYKFKRRLVERNVLEVLKWASNLSRCNLFNGNDKKALDVGCAYGYASNVMQALGYETYGVDVSKWSVMNAKRDSGGQFLLCDAQINFPFRMTTFDLITCFDVLEHLQVPEIALRNMFRICGGVLICTTPNKFVEKPIRKIVWDFDKTHINVKFPSEWEKFAKRTLDFSLLKVETFYDLTIKLGDRLFFFKSFKVPNLGLTARMLVKK